MYDYHYFEAGMQVHPGRGRVNLELMRRVRLERALATLTPSKGPHRAVPASAPLGWWARLVRALGRL